MRNMNSMLLTLLCAVIILGIGYLGIVERGRQILQSESVPERAQHQNTGTNIFYGKIEDNIEIFPWNFYPEDGVKAGGDNIPIFLADSSFVEMYYPEGTVMWDDTMSMSEDEEIQKAQTLDWEMQCFMACDSYFSEIIAYEAGVEKEEVYEWFQKRGNHILENMIVADSISVGSIFFYQDILQLGEKQYQVRIACSEWNVINFICVEKNAEDKRELKEWKEGKEKMIAVLEQSEESLSAYFLFMSRLNDMGAPTIYCVGDEYENAYLYGFRWLGNIMLGREEEDDELIAEIEKWQLEWESILQEQTEKDGMAVDSGEQEVEYTVNYSYQVVELKDMILLLVQGDAAIGLYYDPINQKFCGYNFLYEY